MTVAELKAYAGASDDGGARYYSKRGEHHVTGWTGPVDGRDGWWWALTRKAGDHEVVVAMGWSAGGIRARDIDIARSLSSHTASRVEGKPS